MTDVLSQAGELAGELAVAPGSIVEVRDAVWLVTKATMTTSGMFVEVQGLSDLVRDTKAGFYSDIDNIVPLDPAKASVVGDDSTGYRKAKLWLEATLRKSPVPLNSPGLTVATRMLADPLGYQQAAVRKALDPQNLRPRILIADAVGLGKTLEIGMILSELVRRGRGERILIVTPRHVLEQMQHEMWTRFALPFVRLDSVGIQRVRQKLPATRNPFSLYKRAIISIDTLKQEKYRAHLAKHKWDAVVIDESHNITGATLNNRLARVLAPNTEALILASATPHNGKKESFAELIRLLEPTAVTPDGDIIESEAKRLIIRRHRHSEEVAREVGGDWAERLEPQNFLVNASPEENAVADELSSVWLHPSGSSPYSGATSALFPWTLAKAFLSSPAALLESIRERLRKLDASKDTSQAREVEALERLQSLAEASLAGTSAKYAKLLDYLRSIKVGPKSAERAVVFSERVASLGWLRDKLMKDLGLGADQIKVLHGGLSDVEQQETVESFKQSSSPIRVLVTGDVASEGVNLHSQCHELIHFDIPWSLIRIEQRNGRIDRYGQKHPPQISTLLLNPTNSKFSGDVRVLQRLLEREREAHTALGDVASLMGKYDPGAEEDEIRKALSTGRDVDEIVSTVEQVSASTDDPIAALLAQLANAQGSESKPAAAAPEHTVDATTGLFADDVSFLREALYETFVAPAAPAAENGVEWLVDDAHSFVSLVPTRDLAQRLEVLPQSYLRDRKVTEKLKLVVAEPPAKALLKDARDNKASTSLWPEAHFLGPLHPVLEWASDRALSKLGRNQVFAVRGDVEYPTVLLLASLTNRRGQVVASSHVTVQFPDPSNTKLALTNIHATAQEALAEVGFAAATRVNPGAVKTGSLQHLIAPAVENAASSARQLAVSSTEAIEARIESWSSRIEEWERSADAMPQLEGLKSRRVTVEEERTMAESMKPNQQLVRPLLVVVPQDFVGEDPAEGVNHG
ncbi:helicase-related protein [Salinibacterium sp. TMP30]|uniref:helicase-related protein n=1 Tax=Salinibacterium sp. TMP30 TaxID=3138237 RepID=UPI00313A3E49